MKVNGINSRWREIVVAAVVVAIVVTVVVAVVVVVVVAAVVVVVALVAVVVGGDVFLQTENGKVMILLRLAANRDKMVFLCSRFCFFCAKAKLWRSCLTIFEGPKLVIN